VDGGETRATNLYEICDVVFKTRNELVANEWKQKKKVTVVLLLSKTE
jgi:hypothetical protein